MIQHSFTRQTRCVAFLVAVVVALLAGPARAADVTITGRVVDADTFEGVSGIYIRATIGDFPVANVSTADDPKKEKDPKKGTFNLTVPGEKGILELHFVDLTPLQKYQGSKVPLLVAGDGIKLNVALLGYRSKRQTSETSRNHILVAEREYRLRLSEPKADPKVIRKLFAPVIENIDRTLWKKFENPPDQEYNSLLQELQGAHVAPAPVFSPDSKFALVRLKENALCYYSVTKDGGLGDPVKLPLDMAKWAERDTRKYTILDSDKIVTTHRTGGVQRFELHGDANWSGPVSIAPNASPAIAVARTPDGRVMATGDAAGLVSIFALDENKRLSLSQKLHDATSPVRDLAFSSDAKRLAVVTLSTLSIWDLETGKPQFHRELGNEVANVVRFSGDGKGVVLGTGLVSKGAVRVVSLAGRDPKTAFVLESGPITSLEIASDQMVIAGSPQAGEIYQVDLSTNKTRKLELMATYSGTFSVSPDGKLLGVVTPAGKPSVFKVPNIIER